MLTLYKEEAKDAMGTNYLFNKGLLPTRLGKNKPHACFGKYSHSYTIMRNFFVHL